GEAESRGDLDGAGDRDDVDLDAFAVEVATGRVRVGGRDADAAQVTELAIRAVGGDGGGKPALAVAEGAESRQFRAGLREEVLPGDPEVGDAVADELDHIVRADEKDVEVEVPNPRDEAPLV